jgi:hypothetical protein
MSSSGNLVPLLTPLLLYPMYHSCVLPTEYTQSGNDHFHSVHSIMMEKLAQPDEGGGCTPTPTPLHSIYHHLHVCLSSICAWLSVLPFVGHCCLVSPSDCPSSLDQFICLSSVCQSYCLYACEFVCIVCVPVRLLVTRLWIRIRLRVKSWIRIRFKVKIQDLYRL